MQCNKPDCKHEVYEDYQEHAGDFIPVPIPVCGV